MSFFGRPDKYRRDGTPYPEGDAGLFEWARDCSNTELRIVRQDLLPNGYWVSTVWLGLDHNWGQSGPPIIFETMVQDPIEEWEDDMDRYATEDDAIIGHLHTVDKYKPLWYARALPAEKLEWRTNGKKTLDVFPLIQKGITMPIGCRICIATKGLKGSELDQLPKTYDELYEHLESVHHIPVMHEGENEDQAQTRFLAAHPEALDCEDCRNRNVPWAVPHHSQENSQ